MFDEATPPAPPTNGPNWIGVYAIIRRELKRTFAIINQVVWPPVITTIIYITVFGLGLGRAVGTIEGVPYLAFLLPGLILMNVIHGSYEESASSLFQLRFMNAIQELLLAPLAPWEIVVGMTVGSVARALFTGHLIWLVAWLYVGTTIAHYGLFLLMLVLVAAFFTSVGLIMGLWGEKFDHMAIVVTFVLTPLVYFGGVFNAISMLPEPFRTLSAANPLTYMIDGFRYAMVGTSASSFATNALGIGVATVAAFALVLTLFQRGYKLRP